MKVIKYILFLPIQLIIVVTDYSFNLGVRIHEYFDQDDSEMSRQFYDIMKK